MTTAVRHGIVTPLERALAEADCRAELDPPNCTKEGWHWAKIKPIADALTRAGSVVTAQEGARLEADLSLARLDALDAQCAGYAGDPGSSAPRCESYRDHPGAHFIRPPKSSGLVA